MNTPWQHPSLTPRATYCPVPITANQAWVWNDTLRRRPQRSRARMCVDSAHLLGSLDVASLERSIEALIRCHEPLRTRIVEIAGIPTQFVDPMPNYRLCVEDLTTTDATGRTLYAQRMAESFVHDEIDLSTGPLFDAKLLKLSSSDHVLVLAVDHIVADALSCIIIRDELWRVYRSLLAGEEISLSPPLIQFPDFAAWQHLSHGTWLAQHFPYWIQKLNHRSGARLPTDHELSDHPCPTIAVTHALIGHDLTTSLRHASREARTLLPLLLLTLYVAAAVLRFGHRELLVTFVSNGRHSRPELPRMIGDLAHFMYLRIEAAAAHSLYDLTRQVAAEFSVASAREAWRLPPPSSMELPTDLFFNWSPAAWNSAREAHTERAPDGCVPKQKLFPLSPRTPIDSPARLSATLRDQASGLTLSMAYRSDLFKERTILRLIGDLRWLATKFVESPHAPIASITLPRA